MKKYIVPILAAFLFIFESLFVNQFSGTLFTNGWILVPRFLMIFFIFLAAYGNERKAIWYSFVIGLLFDIVYTGILGVYMAIFPVVTYIFTKLLKILQNNIFVVSVVSLLAVTALEMAIGLFNFMLGNDNMTFSVFASIRLLPTVLFNLAVTVLVAYPFKKWISEYAEDKNSDMLFTKGK
ncbi:MAG: rod shape-determining protein MreD [Bacillus sp. (in: firmicutes)]